MGGQGSTQQRYHSSSISRAPDSHKSVAGGSTGMGSRANNAINVQFQPADLRAGVDIVRISRISSSLSEFGDRFVHRLFTERESAYAAQSTHLVAERLAARFAA